MNQENVVSFYRQISVAGSNPGGLVVKLYDAILDDFRRAKEAIAGNNVKERVARLNHALLIIAELDSVLDFERGGIVAKQLHGFYSVMRGLIVEANIKANQEDLEKLIAHFTPLRKAWQQVEQDIALQKIKLPEDRPSNSAKRNAPAEVSEPEANAPHWNV